MTEEKEKCEWCDNEATITQEVYNPWGLIPYIDHLCEECYENDVYIDSYGYCETCNRYIWHSNGHRVNMRVTDCEYICYACLQDKWFKNGMELPEKELDGDFFNYSDLQNHGYVEIESFYGSYGKDKCRKKFEQLNNDGKKCIINIDSMAISGSGCSYTIWAK